MIALRGSEPHYVQHRFSQPRDRVFRQWMSAAAIKVWFGDTLHDVASPVVEPQVGGRFALTLVPKSPSGTTWNVEGRFVAVETPSRIELEVMWSPADGSIEGWRSRIVASFATDGQGTLLSVMQAPLEPESAPTLATRLRETLSGLRSTWGASPIRLRWGACALAVGLVALATLAASLTGVVLYGTFRAALPVEDAERLGMIWLADTENPTRWLAPAEVTELATSGVGLEMAPLVDGAAVIGHRGHSFEASTVATTANFFSILNQSISGVAALGSLSSEPVASVLISERLWATNFNRVPVDQLSLSLNGEAVTVAGIVPSTFRFLPPSSVFPREVDVWRPYRAAVSGPVAQSRSVRFVHVLIKTHVDWAKVTSVLQATLQRWRGDYAADYSALSRAQLIAEPLIRAVTRDVRDVVTWVATAGLLLAFAAVVAAQHFVLQAYRACSASLAIGLALGATVRRLSVEALRACILTCTAGTWLALLALIVASRSMPLVAAFDPATFVSANLWTLFLAFTLSGLVLGGLIAVPVVLLIRGLPLVESLKDHRSGGGWGRGTLLGGRSFALALACLLGGVGVIGAHVLWALAEQERLKLDFRHEGVVAFKLNLADFLLPDDEQCIAWINDVLRRVEQEVPATESGMLTLLPSSGSVRGTTVAIGKVETPAAIRGMTPGIFDVLQLRTVQGAIPTTNVAGTERYAIVDQALARKLEPSGDVVGKTVRWVPGEMDFQVVAIVNAARFDGPHGDAAGTIFLPVGPYRQRSLHLVVHGLAPHAAEALVLDAIAASGTPVPASKPIDIDALVVGHYQRYRVGSLVIALYWVLLAGVSAVGFAAVAALWLSEHEKESGIRRAVGATPRDIRGWALRSWASPVGWGSIIGIALASFLLTRLAPDAAWLRPAVLSLLSSALLIASVVGVSFRKVARETPLVGLLRA